MTDEAPKTEVAEPERHSWLWSLLHEDAALRLVFWLMLGGAGLVLGLDAHQLRQEAAASIPARQGPVGPVVTKPPSRTDQVRPYFPVAAPRRLGEGAPDLPGVVETEADLLAAPMSFVRGPKGAASAVGRIEAGVAAEFARFVSAQNGEVKALYLHSPGGSVQDALEMAALIREEGIDTVVVDNAYCASSCPLIFSGGVKRSVGAEAWVGVHQIFPADATRGDLSEGMAQAQATSARIQAHLTEMGVDPALWIHAMETPSDSLYLLTQEELRDYRLATAALGGKGG